MIMLGGGQQQKQIPGQRPHTLLSVGEVGHALCALDFLGFLPASCGCSSNFPANEQAT